jgi:hypothetical protein
MQEQQLTDQRGGHRATRNRRRARSSQELTDLFNERADLKGVSPVADFFVESVRWSA